MGLTIYRTHPPKVDAPGGIRPIKTDLTKRDRNLCCPMIGVFLDLRLPLCVPTHVKSTLVADPLIRLCAECVDGKNIAVALIVIGIKHHLNTVVLPDRRIPTRHGFSEALHVRLLAAHTDIECVFIVKHPNLGV